MQNAYMYILMIKLISSNSNVNTVYLLSKAVISLYYDDEGFLIDVIFYLLR